MKCVAPGYLLLFPIALSFLAAGAARAQTSTPVPITDEQVNAVARELNCPTCDNVPLDVCPTQACADMRAEIRQLLGQGWTKAQIQQLYIQRYGDKVLRVPVITADQVNAVARELYCPECENIPLDVCPSQACADMRSEIRQKLELGWTKDQIKQYYIQRYGDRVVGTPPARGWNWLVYIIPPVAILGGVAILYSLFRAGKALARRTVQQAAEAPNPPPAPDDYIARLEAELKEAKK